MDRDKCDYQTEFAYLESLLIMNWEGMLGLIIIKKNIMKVSLKTIWEMVMENITMVNNK